MRRGAALHRFFFDVAQDLFFAADIVLNFHTGIMRQGAVVMNSSLIVRRYLHVRERGAWLACRAAHTFLTACAATLASCLISLPCGVHGQGFFVLDLVATIPIDYISFAFGTDETQLLTASRWGWAARARPCGSAALRVRRYRLVACHGHDHIPHG